MNDLVRIAIDAYNGTVEKYSVSDAQETLRKALIAANGGDTKIDIRKIRDGECNKVFAIIEEILRVTVPAGLQENDLFKALVEYKNVAEGDQNVFAVEGDTLFFVDDIAKGTQGIRRQRFADYMDVTVPTVMHGIRIYEELARVLAGRVDFNTLIDKVNESVKNQILTEIYAVWHQATSAELGGAYYPATVGAYSEDALLEIIEHVEAAGNGATATIIGTKKALRKLADNIATPSDKTKDDLYENGYIGKFFGSPVICVPQRHKAGTTNFVFDDKEITVIATGAKPIKFVYEGDPLVIFGNPADNADLTQEYFLAEQWGMAFAMASNAGIGKYVFS